MMAKVSQAKQSGKFAAAEAGLFPAPQEEGAGERMFALPSRFRAFSDPAEKTVTLVDSDSNRQVKVALGAYGEIRRTLGAFFGGFEEGVSALSKGDVEPLTEAQATFSEEERAEIGERTANHAAVETVTKAAKPAGKKTAKAAKAGPSKSAPTQASAPVEEKTPEQPDEAQKAAPVAKTEPVKPAAAPKATASEKVTAPGVSKSAPASKAKDTPKLTAKASAAAKAAAKETAAAKAPSPESAASPAPKPAKSPAAKAKPAAAEPEPAPEPVVPAPKAAAPKPVKAGPPAKASAPASKPAPKAPEPKAAAPKPGKMKPPEGWDATVTSEGDYVLQYVAEDDGGHAYKLIVGGSEVARLRQEGPARFVLSYPDKSNKPSVHRNVLGALSLLDVRYEVDAA